MKGHVSDGSAQGTMKARVVDGWNAFWFADGTAFNLAMVRVLIAIHSLWILLSRDFAGVSEAPAVFRNVIPAVVRLRYGIFEGQAGMDALLHWLAVGALVLVLLGVVPRAAALIAALAIYHLAPLESIIWTWQPVARGLTLAPVALLLMAFSKSGDALTILPRRGPSPGPSWEYHWPVRLLQFLVIQLYFFAGVGKLIHTGLAWGSAENIRLWLIWSNVSPQINVFSSLGLWIAEHPRLCAAIGYGTLTFELGSPLVLIWPRLVAAFVPLAILLHLGILFSMNIYVGEAWYLFVFIDWRNPIPKGPWSASSNTPTSA